MELNTIKKLKPKKCKACKNIYTPFFPLQQVCSKSCEIEIKTKQALKNLDKIKQEEKRSWTERKKIKSIDAHSQKHKQTLQKEINELARMIDEHCGYNTCIDCGKIMDKQIHGSHFENVQGHENIRYNLLNIHSSRSECNQHHGGNKRGYEIGLIERYGKEVYNEIQDLDLKYKNSHFTNKEIYEKIAVVRKLKRDLKTFVSKDAIFLRNTFNSIIGLYK